VEISQNGSTEGKKLWIKNNQTTPRTKDEILMMKLNKLYKQTMKKINENNFFNTKKWILKFYELL